MRRRESSYVGFLISLGIVLLVISYFFTRFIVILGCDIFNVAFTEKLALFVWLVLWVVNGVAVKSKNG